MYTVVAFDVVAIVCYAIFLETFFYFRSHVLPYYQLVITMQM